MPFESPFAKTVYLNKYSKDQKEEWEDTCKRVSTSVIGEQDSHLVNEIHDLMKTRRFIPAGRYLYASGRPFHQVNNCFLYRAEDSREGWAEKCFESSMALMTGGGIGIDYSDVRPEGAIIKRTGGVATGPIALMRMINEIGRNVMQGGSRRSAIWAGLNWKHGDIDTFMSLKDWPDNLRALKEKDFTFPMDMELTNISVIYDTEFFSRYRAGDAEAKRIFARNVRQACSTAEPGFAFNYLCDRESLRNACTEVVSEDDGDKCNLGTLWLSHFTDIDEFASAVAHATRFLMHGGQYTLHPSEKTERVGCENNRIGLGLGGMHEWLMQRGYGYEVNSELREWLEVYQAVSDETAKATARQMGVPVPKGVRAIAPTGTIGILAETTTGIEPLFCKAYKRRYYDAARNVWKSQYVVDGAVKRLQQRGITLDKIQDAYDLSFEERVRFQADVQDYVDMSISSTCNIPAWGSEQNNESTLSHYETVLYDHAKRLRGFTMYADGARGGQPLTRVSVEEALRHEGTVFEETMDECVGGVCGA